MKKAIQFSKDKRIFYYLLVHALYYTTDEIPPTSKHIGTIVLFIASWFEVSFPVTKILMFEDVKSGLITMKAC
jgi:hypothetical protein